MKKIRLNIGGVGRGPSQAAMAREMQIDVGTLSRWERDMSTPSEAHMLLWALKVGVDEGVAMARLRGEETDAAPSTPPPELLITGNAAEMILSTAKGRKITPQAAAEMIVEAGILHLPTSLPVEDYQTEEPAGERREERAAADQVGAPPANASRAKAKRRQGSSSQLVNGGA